jgi:hypothetical protein
VVGRKSRRRPFRRRGYCLLRFIHLNGFTVDSSLGPLKLLRFRQPRRSPSETGRKRLTHARLNHTNRG